MSDFAQEAYEYVKDSQPTTGATKNDKADCKVEVDLFPPSAYYAISTVFTYGKHKYDSWNWAKGLAYSRMYGALQRHLNAWFSGQDLDPETGFSHLWHAGCNIAMLIHTEMVVKDARVNPLKYLPEKQLLDDRPMQFFPPVIMEQFSSILKENKAFQELVQKKSELTDFMSGYAAWVAGNGVQLAPPAHNIGGMLPLEDQNTEGRV